MQTITLEATTRGANTKSAMKKLRADGLVPAVLYHKHDENVSFSVKEISLRKLIYTTESHLVNLKFADGREQQAVMKETQFDPVSDVVIHADFQALRADEKIEIEVPTIYKGVPVGVTVGGGRVQVLAHKVSIRCLPADIPEHLEFDIANINLGETIHLSEARVLFAGAKFSFVGDDSIGLVSVTTVRTEVAAAPVAADATKVEPEVIAKGKEKTGEKEEAAPAKK